jgi:hypothetical protein
MRMRTPSWDAAVCDAHRLCAAVRRRECCAYQFADGFDNYNSATLLYETVAGTITYGTAYRRFVPPAGLPGQGIKFSGGVFSSIRKNLLSNQATLIIKVAVYFTGFGSTNTYGNPFLAVSDGTGVQWWLTLLQSGAIGLSKSGNSGPLVAQTGPGVIATNTWYGIEIEVTISSTVGTCSLWVNGVSALAVTGINTQSTSNAYGNQVSLGDLENRLANFYADDFRVWDSTGSTQNAPAATDTQIITKLPSGAGAFASWTPNGAAANWQCVDDNPPDDDTTYVSASVASAQDAYAMPSAGLSQAPLMVVARSRVRTDGGTHTLEIGVVSGGFDAAGATFTPGSTYGFIDSCIADDPATTAPWTAAAADAAQHWKNELS